MRCAFDCLLFIQDYFDVDTSKGIGYLEGKLSEKGISIYDFCNAVMLCNLNCKAISSWCFPKKISILLVKGKNSGHYLVFIKKTLFSIVVYDGRLGIRKVNKFVFYWIWSRISIIIEK